MIVQVPIGKDDYVEDSWDIKKTIFESEGKLHQDYRFFSQLYKTGNSYVFIENGVVKGFATVSLDGYLSLMGVHPISHRSGVGTQLMSSIEKDYKSIICHVRENNEKAIEFYSDNGFVLLSREIDYYNNDDDALVLGKNVN